MQKVIPQIKEQWVVVKTSAEPHLKTIRTKTTEVYETSKNALAPHVSKVQEVVDPYFQVFILNIIIAFGNILFKLRVIFVLTGSKKAQQAIY